MLEIPVKLIVKAPNQQVEDQTIQCNLSWTIKRLKGHLSEVHPSKPNTEDQRLIYYGQLLNDSVTLKDVFTKYEAGEETHTVHLVCVPSKETLKMQTRKLAEEKNKRAKERVNANGGASTSGQRPVSNGTQNMPEGNPNFTGAAERNYFQAGYQNWMAGGAQTPESATNNYIQQWQWLQMTYASYYMHQYLNMVARQNALGGRGGTRQDDDIRNPAPQNRNVDDDDNHNHIHRDWLDCLYTMSRFVVLFSIVYFYSSPMRFLIVSSLGLILYLYQIGFFRVQYIDENEMVNNNVPVNNNFPVNNNNVIRPGNAARADRVEPAMPAQPNPNPEPEVNRNPNPDPTPNANANVNANANANANANDNDNANANPNENANPNPNLNSNGQRAVGAQDHPSFIARTWIFVTTFFSSMIPETDNAM